MKDNRKTIQVLVILTIMFTVIGGSLAYWNWNTTEEQKTNVVFTLTQDFSCAADGGGNITSNDVSLAPTTCTDTSRAIKRKVTVTPTVNKDDLIINMDLWLDIKDIGEGLSESENFKYVLTTSDSSCEEGTILASGNFKGLQSSDQAYIMMNKKYSASISEEYYLYIWLDKEETSSSTMNQTFSLSLGGSCTNDPMTPELDDGMIPVTIADDGTVTTVSADDSGWYDYDNQQWANVVLVKENATSGVEGSQSRSYYQSNLSNNVEVVKNDILGYYVWIPRYKYRIPYQTCASIPESERNQVNHSSCYGDVWVMSENDRQILIDSIQNGGECYYDGIDGVIYMCYDSNGGKTPGDLADLLLAGGKIYATAGVYEVRLTDWVEYAGIEISMQKDVIFLENNKFFQPIDIVFENKNESKKTGNAVTTYRTHPAFWWDDNNNSTVDTEEMLAGIWVGKFETTGDEGTPTVLPNRSPLIYQSVSNQFTTSQKFSKIGNIYGLSNTLTDAHMAKNSEWGAAAYLSHSEYGINKEVRLNNYYDLTIGNYYQTGCGAAFDNAEASITCAITYGSGVSEYPQSTTGNITGVFDMSGGADEYVMGHYGNTINSDIDYSDFTTLPNVKYYDLYSSTQFTGDYETNTELCTLETCGGHALNETSGWYDDSADFIYSDPPWFCRGGYAGGGASAGTFSFTFGGGYGGDGLSWRSVLVVR